MKRKFLLLVISLLLIFTIGMILPQECIVIAESKININNGVYTNKVQSLATNSTSKLYFSPGFWSGNDASFAIRVFNSDSEQVYQPLVVGDSGYYEIEYSVEMENVSFVCYNSDGTAWWNEMSELEIPSNNLFVITSLDSYLWDEYLTASNAGEFGEGDILLY